jgi:hypothetical protein
VKIILQKLISRLEQVPSVKEVKIYNNQLTKLDKEEITLFPCAFIELDNIEYTTMPERNQYATMTVRIHIVGNSLTQGSNEDYDIYEVKEEINRYLYGFSSEIFTPLERNREETDSNHDSLYIYKIEYKTRFTEYIEPVNPVSIIIDEIYIDYDLDIDNPIIRTGDNK